MIKFRYVFRHKSYGIKFLYFTLNEIEEKDIPKIVIDYKITGWEFVARNRFTGFLDQCNHEIYEGDIVYEEEDKDEEMLQRKKGVTKKQTKDACNKEPEISDEEWLTYYDMVPLKIAGYVLHNEDNNSYIVWQFYLNDEYEGFTEELNGDIPILYKDQAKGMKILGNVYELRKYAQDKIHGELLEDFIAIYQKRFDKSLEPPPDKTYNNMYS